MEKRNQFEHELLDYDVAVAGFDEDYDNKLKVDLAASVKIIPECALINLGGYIDEHNYMRFQKQVMLAIKSGFSKIIFDCAELTYISSIGMGAFSDLLKEVRQKGGGIALLRPQQKVYNVFHLLGFSSYFPKMNSLEDAIRYFVNLKEKVFPKVFLCPVCSKKLRATQPGVFRCSGCQTVLSVNEEGEVRY